MNRTTTKLSLDEFLNLPESDDRYELVDPQAQSVTVFRKDGRFETLGNNQLINDSLLPELELRVADLFSKP